MAESGISELDRQQMPAYRKRRFKVEVSTRNGTHPGGLDLAITHNGSHWSTIGLMPDEARAVIEALKEALKETA